MTQLNVIIHLKSTVEQRGWQHFPKFLLFCEMSSISSQQEQSYDVIEHRTRYMPFSAPENQNPGVSLFTYYLDQ